MTDETTKTKESAGQNQGSHGSAREQLPASGQTPRGLEQLFSFRGRIGRAAFWLRILVVNVFSFAFLVAASLVVTELDSEAVELIATMGLIALAVAILWVLLATEVQRWHDLGYSAYMLLINLIPLVGGVISTIWLGFVKGEPGPNKYDVGASSVSPAALAARRQRARTAVVVVFSLLLLLDAGVLVYAGWRYFSISTSPHQRVEIVIKDSVGVTERPVAIQQAISVMEARLAALGVDYYDVRKGANVDIEARIAPCEDPHRVMSVMTARAKLETRPVAWPLGDAQPMAREAAQTALASSGRPDLELLTFSERSAESSSGGDHILVQTSPVMTGADVRDASVTRDDYSKNPAVRVNLTPAGAARFGQWTEAHIGERLAFVFNDRVLQVVTVTSRIEESSVIKGTFSSDEAADLALVLNSGNMPRNLAIVSEVVERWGFPAPKSLLYVAIGAGILFLALAFGLVTAIRRSRSVVSPLTA